MEREISLSVDQLGFRSLIQIGERPNVRRLDVMERIFLRGLRDETTL